jgi:hypothetical protein
MANTIDISSAIMNQLTKYSDDVMKESKLILKDEANKLVQTLKDTSPNRTGDYAKGWTAKLEYENNMTARFVVYNKDAYQLTHLLEYGHANRDGSRTESKAHIAPAEQEMIQNVQKRMEEAVSSK